jgi:SAM-dependent methyltransferase
MSWDPVWERIHASREWGKYPTEELIRFVARNYYDQQPRGSVRFLDLGCGNGSATWYLCREGFSVTAFDGSETAIKKLRDRLAEEHLTADYGVGDAGNLPYPDGSFDCLVDLLCLMCNDIAGSDRILKQAYRVLKPGGKLFSYTPKKGTWGDGTGRPIDKATRGGVTEGPFANMGVVRFSSLEELEELYAPYFELSVESVERSMNDRRNVVGFWVVTGRRR